MMSKQNFFLGWGECFIDDIVIKGGGVFKELFYIFSEVCSRFLLMVIEMLFCIDEFF